MSIDEPDARAKAAINLKIAGLSCASCVNRVETALKQVPGVLSADVNLVRASARVAVVPGTATVDDLAQAVKKVGYAAELEPPHQHGASHMHHADASRTQLILAIALTVPVMVMSMAPEMFPALDEFVRVHIGVFAWRLVEAVLTTIVLFGPGRVFFATGIPALLRGAPEMNSLVAVGTFAAWSYSLVATFLPRAFPNGTANVYFEAAAVISTLVLLGRTLEARARRQAGAAIEHLLRLAPDTAIVLRDGAPQNMKLEAIVPGDIVLIRPGDRVPLDGEVIDGASRVDESMLTGEPQTVPKAIGAPVFGGTVNDHGSLTVRVTKVGADTVLARIVQMVSEAQGAKLPMQALADRVTAWFVPAVIGVALVTFVGWMVFGPQPALAYAL